MNKHIRTSLVRLQIVNELFSFLWKQKLWWSMPIVLIIMLLSAVLFLGGATGTTPFIYALF